MLDWVRLDCWFPSCNSERSARACERTEPLHAPLHARPLDSPTYRSQPRSYLPGGGGGRLLPIHHRWAGPCRGHGRACMATAAAHGVPALVRASWAGRSRSPSGLRRRAGTQRSHVPLRAVAAPRGTRLQIPGRTSLDCAYAKQHGPMQQRMNNPSFQRRHPSSTRLSGFSTEPGVQPHGTYRVRVVTEAVGVGICGWRPAPLTWVTASNQTVIRPSLVVVAPRCMCAPRPNRCPRSILTRPQQPSSPAEHVDGPAVRPAQSRRTSGTQSPQHCYCPAPRG